VYAYANLLKQKENEKFHVTFAGSDEKLELTARPLTTPTPEAIVIAKDRLGLTVEELTPQIAQKYGVLDDQGMLVTQVARNSVAARTGIQPGDVIIALGNYPVTSLKQFSNLMRMLPEQGRVRIEISRAGQRGRGVLQL
jgi:type II secretory pathway component PulC